jgi:uncharacterized iron-regulated membrane protein
MRRLVSWLHLWVGLVAGLLFAVLGLSGSVLVFHEDLLRWQHPELEGHALRADGDVLAAILARETPKGLRSVQFPDEAMPTFVGFYGDGRRGYFAPEDGELLLMRSTGDDVLLWLQDLHIHFLAGDAGEQVVGIVGWTGVGLLVTGLYLWWPKRGRLKLSLTWFSNPPTRRWLSWHRSSGALLLPLVLLLTLTGVGMVYHEAARGLLTTVFGGGDIPAAPVRAGTGDPDWPAVIARAQSGLPAAHLTRTAAPAAGEGVVSFRARMPGEWHVNGRSTVHVDLAGSEVLLAHDATRQAAGARMTEAIYPLHIGAVGGPLVRWLTALGGLVPAFLLATGFLFWLRRPSRQ